MRRIPTPDRDRRRFLAGAACLGAMAGAGAAGLLAPGLARAAD
ncbi:twin-arginine translocation signal domain-containing protein, partial [Achromobacter animicus]